MLSRARLAQSIFSSNFDSLPISSQKTLNSLYKLIEFFYCFLYSVAAINRATTSGQKPQETALAHIGRNLDK